MLKHGASDPELRVIEEKPGRILKMYDFSRYSRNRRIQSEVKERIERAGGKLEFVAERFDNMPEGNLQFNLKGDMLVYERDKTRDRTMNSRRNTAKGIKASTPYKQQPSRSMVPWGFVVSTKADIIRGTYPSETLGRYLIVPENRHILTIVAAMFSRYAMQESYDNIGEWLEASEVLPPKHARQHHCRETGRVAVSCGALVPTAAKCTAAAR